jgi:hypothetical protein
MWAQLATNVIMVYKLLKFWKLVEITIIMVVSTMEDDKKFSIINFMKFKLGNHLTTHLDLVV